MAAARVYRLMGERGELLLLDASAEGLHLDVIDGYKRLRVEVGGPEFLEALAGLLREQPRLLMEQRSSSCDYYGCNRIHVPSRSLIAELLLALREPLARAPRATRTAADDEDPAAGWAWSPEEEAAARKAAILLDIAAMLLRHPELVEKLPEDVEMLAKKHSEGTLFQYIKSAKAEVVD